MAIAAPTTRPIGARMVAVAALFGAELVHTTVIPQHLREWSVAGWFFLLVSVIEGLLGAALWFVPSRPAVRAAVWVSLGTVAVWVVSRSVGVPFGPEAWLREPVGKADLAASVLELATVGLLVAGGRIRTRWTARVGAFALVAVVAVTAIGLAAGPGPTAGPRGHATAAGRNFG